ncbi:MAG: hypothetical protein K2M87_07155 [Muribaculaceae bacterium]|nr:hypothetical protein [Muribaculaceae bacterium]
MKKIYIIPIIALMTACGGHKSNSSSSDTDSLPVAEQSAPEAASEVYSLTADSIGPVRVGDAVASLPQAVANLYDFVLTTSTPDAMAYTFLLQDIPQFTIYDFMDGRVDVIALEGDARGVVTPSGMIHVGEPFTKVLELDGVVSEFAAIDDTGIWYWKWHDLYFGVDETEIGEELAAALCEGKLPPAGKLFTTSVRIGYIATGLPF